MLDDMDQYPPFSPYALNYGNFDHLDMKRAQDSIGGPESVKKARQYPPGAYDQQQAYYQPATPGGSSTVGTQGSGGASASGAQSSPAALYSTTSLNGSIAAPPVLNGVGMGMSMGLNGMNVNGMNGLNGFNGLGVSGLNGLHNGMNGLNGLQSSPLLGYSNNLGAGGQLTPGFGMVPPSPNPAAAAAANQQLFAQQQQQQLGAQGGQQTPSPNQQQQFFQQQQAQQQQQQQQSQQQQQQNQQQQQLNMLNGMNGMMPGMFGGMGGMHMGMPFGFPQMSFQPQGLNGQMLNPIQAAAAAAAGNATGRTVYIGNLPADASVDELLNLVRFGPIESVRVLPERSCVFISFLDGPTAASFHADATLKKLALHGQELKIGWGKPSPVPSQVLLSISQSNASRNVYLGGLDENMTEEMLRDDLSRFGLIDQVKIVRDKNIGFVHFLSISTATKVVATLPTEPAWAGKRVNYGKDRCAYIPKSQQPQTAAAAHAQAVVQQAGLSPLGMSFAPFSPLGQSFPGMNVGLSPYQNQHGGDGQNGAGGNGLLSAGLGAGLGLSTPTGMSFGPGATAANRTVYLGNIHPETTIEEMCNTIRGGALQSVRYLADKHIAFVTFIDPAAAIGFHQLAHFTGLTLNNRRLKIGWGKHSGPLSPSLALSIQAGATRNVYVGNIEDFDKFSVEKLKRDFGEYGEIELVNYLKEKNCAFVNFTNISNAIKAIDGIKSKPEYANLRIAHGKDRCANPPRQLSGGGGHNNNGPNAGGKPRIGGQSSPKPPVSPNSANAAEGQGQGEEEGQEGEGEDEVIPSPGAATENE